MNNLAPAAKKLRDNGFEFKRSGKGDHEIWVHKQSGRIVVVDAKIKIKHTANGILERDDF